MRVFIFGIGGTGARVLRSFTMLLASGIKLNHPDLTIVPIVIDTDAHNGDTNRTRDLLRSYYKIRKHFVNSSANSQSDIFFNTQIRSFSRLDAKATDTADLDVQLNFQNQDNSFANFISYNALSQPNKDLIELLYNDSLDDHPELHLNLSVGFKGNPNIGSVVFNDLMYSQQFKNLESGFTQNDRVFIISSIFGGTGSSGFPTLVKLIRTSKNNHLAQTKIGAITVMPYFKVEAKDGSAIHSALFDTKTKAALSFYAEDSHISSINALYYISDHKQAGSFPNVEGGEGQVNNGHLIELLAATSIVDFINKPDEELETPHYFEFGANEEGSPFLIKYFNDQTKNNYFRSLTKLAFAAKIVTRIMRELTNNMFYGPRELNIGNALGSPNEYNTLIGFFEEFQKWSAVEMSSPNNGRAFNSFSFDSTDNLNALVHGKTIKTTIMDGGLSRKNISNKLNKIYADEPKVTPIPQKYMAMLYKTATECLHEFGQLP